MLFDARQERYESIRLLGAFLSLVIHPASRMCRRTAVSTLQNIRSVFVREAFVINTPLLTEPARKDNAWQAELLS